MNETATNSSQRRYRFGRAATLIGLCAAALAIHVAPASAAVKWEVKSKWAPTPVQAGASGEVDVYILNQGDTAAGPFGYSLKVYLPAGVTYDGSASGYFGNSTELQCPASITVGGEQFGTGLEKVFCRNSFGETFRRFGYTGLEIGFNVAPGVSGPLPYKIEVSGGGAAPAIETGQIQVAEEIFDFGITPGSMKAGTYNPDGSDYTQAGGHPHEASADFDVNVDSNGIPPGGVPRHVLTDLPAGFVGNPTAVPQCSQADFEKRHQCPPASQVGVLFTWGVPSPYTPVYSIDPPPGHPVEFGFWIDNYKIMGFPVVRPDNGYAIQLQFKDQPASLEIPHYKLAIWGVPGDPSHDVQRCRNINVATASCNGTGQNGGAGGTSAPPNSSANPFPADLPVKPFLSNPTNCADPQITRFYASQWFNEGDVNNLKDPNWQLTEVHHPNVTNCEALNFDPTIEFETTEKQADTPTGLNVHLNIPQPGWEDANVPATAHLKKSAVTLPQGVGFNASAADGLEACTTAQIGLLSAPGEVPYQFNAIEPSCPTASKIANAEITTPVLDDKLHGEVFLAAQDDNPFDSTFAIYIVVREPSILVKLPGKVELDPGTGVVTTTFDNNPQLPFSDLDIDFFGGPRASLVTPQTCGDFTTTTEFVPWSAKDPRNPTPEETIIGKDTFSVTSAPNGQGCVGDKAQLPLNAGLVAGSSNPIAGAKSPFDIQITRPDGSQELDKLEISPPPGFVASLKGIPYCSEAQIAATASRESGRDELASSTCPAASQVGTTSVGTGAGSNPLYTAGKLYLAGPYKGETLSVVAVTPAVAGPFDLGNVVVRSALKINPLTARITAVTDPLPRTIAGVPLRIRDIRIALDRPNWAINPTNCEAMSVDVTAYGVDGAVSKPSNRYQLRDCEKLGFKPNLQIKLIGGTKRGDHPSLLATLKTRPGDANIARAAVTLPSSAFLDQAHIRTICTRVQYAADTCPKGAIYGYAKADTPLLDEPLQGDVILRSSNNKLPDLVGRLRGVANIEAVGRIDSVKGGIRNTFDVIPDAPFDVFTLRMQGGNKGLVINSKNLCATTNRATVKFTAQNGRRYNYKPKVIATGCKKGRKGKGNGRARR